ncbi:MAG: ABC transporter permease [Patescibacteria group bacterium]|nr:ABC transporter permease [Patescibacteria group bacterium]
MTPYEQWISYYTIVRKDVVRVLRVWPQTFLPSIVTSALYFLIFGAFLGSRIGQLQGVSYIEFVVPGLVMLSVVMNSYMNSSFAMFSSKFFNRNIDELLVSPTPPWVIVAGFVSSAMLRGVITGVLVLTVALFFTHLSIHSIGIVALFIVLTSLIFALAGLVNGVYAKSIDGINIVPTFVLTPLVYLGGVFYSTELLPSFWSTLTKFDPIFYLINGLRYGFLGIADVSLLTSLAILVVLAGALLATSLYLIRTGLGLKQ